MASDIKNSATDFTQPDVELTTIYSIFNDSSSKAPELTVNQTNSGGSSNRKRNRLSIAPDPRLFLLSSSSSSQKKNHIWESDQPDLLHFQHLLGSLLLTSTLSVISAYDAKQECVAQETYSLLDLVDDDNFQNAYEQAMFIESGKCIHMFRHVVIPTGVITAVLGVYAFMAISSHNSTYARTTPSPIISLQLVIKLLVVLIVVACMQTYNIIGVMLLPRDFSQSKNVYQSLAAVDDYGHVSDNANLYYMIWLSQGLALSLVYQVGVATVRLGREASNHAESDNLLRSTSWQLSHDLDKESRAMWYKSLYRLRIRTGIWTAALMSCLVIVASSQYVWTSLLGPYATHSSQLCQVVAAQSNLGLAFCRRTLAAWSSGIVAAALCAAALCMHWWARRNVIALDQENHLPSLERLLLQKRLPLQTELTFSILLSLLLGFNAVFTTSVDGPAPTVGNLYYASWLSFLLCIRICLACLEEYYNIHENEHIRDNTDERSNASSEHSLHTDLLEKERAKRTRGFFFLAIFSLVSVASAYDASCSQNSQISRIQIYMIIAPLIVTILSGVLFGLCLSKVFYSVASHFCVGGLLSIASFMLWFINLILTMHSSESWAVNGIGEIKNANLYYFSWASIISAGLQMVLYVKSLFRVDHNDFVSVIWASVCKICFVILGASMHIWHTISDNCDFDEITSGAVTFCSRTVFAMIVALSGILVGGLVVFGRFSMAMLPIYQCNRFQAHVEMIVSAFLVFLFGAAVALITGIGGPGQSVGDLFYSTWLAFGISIGIFFHCYERIQREDKDISADKGAIV